MRRAPCHPSRPHFGLELCKSCYVKARKPNRVLVGADGACPHEDRPHYAKGKCETCYVREWRGAHLDEQNRRAREVYAKRYAAGWRRPSRAKGKAAQ